MAQYRRGVLAARLLQDTYQLKTPIDVEFLAVTKMGIPIIRYDFPDELCGTLAYHNGQPTIGVNGNHPIVRQRFTISHEIIHHVRDHGASMCLAGSDGWKEVEANTGAAELLMPAAYVKYHAWHYNYDIERLARRYNVSRQAMTIRLQTLGLIARPEEDKPLGGVFEDRRSG